MLLVAVGQRHGLSCLNQQVSAPPDVSRLRAASFFAHKSPAFSTPLALSPFADMCTGSMFLAIMVHRVVLTGGYYDGVSSRLLIIVLVHIYAPTLQLFLQWLCPISVIFQRSHGTHCSNHVNKSSH
ncbi:hypothetical protein V8C34DRAFT_289640 [Trichoderma compactum]